MNLPSTIIFSFDHAKARCLWVDRDLLYVGSCHDDDDHFLCVLDRRAEVVMQSHTLPFVVCDVIVIGDDCYASLGPGKLAHWSDRTLHAKPEITEVDANAPKLAGHGSSLFWGTSWGDICRLEHGRIAGVKKSLSSIAVDAEHVYAGYDDGKVRSFTHDGKRARTFAAGRRATRVAANAHAVVTGDAATGQINVWRQPGFTAGSRITHAPDGIAYGVVGLAIFDRWIVSNTFAELQIHDIDGTHVATWQRPATEDDIEDVWLDEHGLLIAAGPHVHAVSRAALGC